MLVICQGPECGKQFETKSKRAKFCSPACRLRGHRSGAVVPMAEPEEVLSSGLLDATRDELERAGVADSVLGQQALELARRMSDPRSMGSSVATMSRELRAVMVEAMRAAPVASGLDELRSRRDRKRHAG